MKRIIINSDINAESIALMCAHIQNVQTHSVVITDSFTLLKYGEKVNDIDLAELETLGLTNIYCSKLDDVMIVVSPDLINTKSAEEFNGTLEKIEQFLEKTTLETIEACTVYLGSTFVSNDILSAAAESTASTLVNFNMYKTYQKFTDQFNWTEAATEQDNTVDGKYLSYTCIFNKKLQKKAAELNRPVLFFSTKDLEAIANGKQLDKWQLTGLVRSLSVEIITQHLGVNKECVESWLQHDIKK